MKKIISLLLSVVMLLSMTFSLNVFAADLNATENTDADIALELSEYFGDSFDSNYFTIPSFTISNYVENNYVKLTFSTTSTDEIELGVAKWMANKEKFVEVSCIDSFDAETEISLDSIKISADKPKSLYFKSTASEFLTTAGEVTLGVVLKDSTKLSSDAAITVKIDGVPLAYDFTEGENFWFDDTNAVNWAEFNKPFLGPVTFSYDCLDGFAKVLTAIKFENTVTADDVAAAVDAVSAETDITTLEKAIAELKTKITDNNLNALAEVYDKANITVEKNTEYGVELPWAALAAGTNGVDTTFAPIVYEGTVDSITTEGKVVLPEGKDDYIALDISLGANGTAVAPIVKQKVVVELPNGWDLTKGVQYKHGTTEWKNAIVEGNTAILYVNSFSNFIFAGTKATAVENDITKTVNVVVKQDETNTNEFKISIKPEADKQIMNFAVGGFSIDIRNEGITENAMTSTSYDLIAADGIVITNEVVNENDYVLSINFNTQVADQGLITAGKNGEIEIAKFILTGKGAFRMVIGGVDKYNVTSTENYIMMDKDADKVNDAYAKILNADAKYSIVEKPYNLNFNIKYDLGISDKKDADYLDMVINITNTTTRETKKVMVGTKGTESADAYLELVTTGDDYDDESVATGSIKLEGRTTYEYEVVAGGYRKFSGSVYLDEEKTINLWSTVYNNKQPVIQGDDRVENQKYVTFLVGDIWMDNKVDVYDLSAVTAYFGTQNIEAGSNFVQYDLDRDGDVDLRDIGYVQLTFGN